MVIAGDALARAQEIENSYSSAVLALRLESPLDAAAVVERAQAAIASLDGPASVYWSVDAEPAGVIVRQWGFTPDIGATLAALSGALEERGVEGRLVPHYPEPSRCRVRRCASARDHLDAIAHEERLAPDAYAIQLLGPGYAGRVPTGEDWRTIPLPGKRVLLERVKLGPWFDELTIDEAWQGESLPRHAAVEPARADLTPILFAPISKDQREREHAWDMAHPHVRLSDDIIAKVHALPTGPYVGHWDVALILRDGSVIDDVELGWQGAIVTRVAGAREFTLDPTDVVDVRPASGG